MRFNLPRRFVPALLVAALVIAPLPASAAPGGSVFESHWGSLVEWAGNLLRHLWAEEGVSIDPFGRPEPVPALAPEDGRHLWAEEGVSIDPLGRTTPPPAAAAPEGQ